MLWYIFNLSCVRIWREEKDGSEARGKTTRHRCGSLTGLPLRNELWQSSITDTCICQSLGNEDGKQNITDPSIRQSLGNEDGKQNITDHSMSPVIVRWGGKNQDKQNRKVFTRVSYSGSRAFHVRKGLFFPNANIMDNKQEFWGKRSEGGWVGWGERNKNHENKQSNEAWPKTKEILMQSYFEHLQDQSAAF